MAKKKTRLPMQWRAMDFHIHTPASIDYQQTDVTYIDILKRADARGLDILSFTDHNTIAGYRRMQEEIQQLEVLKSLKRILPEEQFRLDEYHRLLAKMLILPGFEFTATFGFHVIALFSPLKSLRDIEHLLLDLRIPSDQLDAGSATVGATSDVLTAYRKIAEAGGLVIAAHANSSNGVAMRGFPLGGQTKIAYTQDPNLHALEVTDLDKKGSGSTAAFFNGAKPEYPRRMHCIQGSDCHRLTTDQSRKKNLGVGDRATDVLLPEVTFIALYELFTSNDFARTRPHHQTAEPAYDFIHSAREEGANIIQDFHETMTVRAGKRYAIIADICALANTNGGTLYVGLSANPKEPILGVPDPEPSLLQLDKEIEDHISPPLECTLDIQETSKKKIIRILVPRGDDPPYAVDDNKIYIRNEAETDLAVRDEIVSLVKRNVHLPTSQVTEKTSFVPESVENIPEPEIPSQPPSVQTGEILTPRTGVEVVSVEERNGRRYFTLRDLRNGNKVSNVTKTSARRLWHYAITTYNNLPNDLSKAEISWQGDIGLLGKTRQNENLRYDLVQRQGNSYRCFFGVTEDGIDGPWRELVGMAGSGEEE
jgi:hypothetical protein